MAALNDIEQAPEDYSKRGSRGGVPSSIDTSHRTGNLTDDPSRTSKSKQIMMNLDPTVLELIDAGDDYSDDSEKTYQDPLFGSCCDLVKVCLIVDSLYIFQKTQLIITILLGWSVVDPDDLDLRVYEDDQVEAYVSRLDMINIILLLKEGLGIPFGIVGLFGAGAYRNKRFYKSMVLTMGIWCIIDFLWGILFQRWLSAVYVAFYIYPHFALFVALHKGRITNENYEDIKHCCCSTKKRCC